jgi:Cu/Ag efflux protein CusF
MFQANRRRALTLLGGGVLATAVPAFAGTAAAQQQDLYVPKVRENFKRGTIHSIDPKTRGMVVIWEDLGRVKMKASDLVVKDTVGDAYDKLKPGQVVDLHWYDYMDFLIAKQSPEATARAKSMVAQGARIEGLPNTQQAIRLWQMDGMLTKVDPTTNTFYLINASGGDPDLPAPDSGEVIMMPQVVTANGTDVLKTLKPGDKVTVVYSVQTAIKAKIIR